MSDRKLNWKQACTLLDCKKDKFYELIRIGRLPATRVGERGIRVKESDVLRLVRPLEPDDGGAGQENTQKTQSFVG